jgi:hypothetical protein
MLATAAVAALWHRVGAAVAVTLGVDLTGDAGGADVVAGSAGEGRGAIEAEVGGEGDSRGVHSLKVVSNLITV